MTRPRILKIAMALLAIIALTAVVLVLVNPFSSATRHPAFLNSTWGMSPKEVQSKLGLPIYSGVVDWSDVLLSDTLSKSIANHTQFSTFALDNSEFSLWNYRTMVYFNFFDNRLYEYTVSLSSEDSTKLDSTIVSQLTSKYGPPRDAQRSEWHSSSVRVKYAILHWGPWDRYRTDLPQKMKESKPNVFDQFDFQALVRVTYIPLEDEIKEAAKQEGRRIF